MLEGKEEYIYIGYTSPLEWFCIYLFLNIGDGVSFSNVSLTVRGKNIYSQDDARKLPVLRKRKESRDGRSNLMYVCLLA